MFFKKNSGGIKVKKASDIINAGSHKQKKYLSLMLVPSYTTGKTRTLRIPRATFYCLLVALFAVSAVIAGLQIRGTYMQRMAQDYRAELEFTQEAFDEHIFTSNQHIDEWVAEANRIGVELDAEQIARQRERLNIQNNHQSELDNIQSYLDEIRREMSDMWDELNTSIEGASLRAFIPAVNNVLTQLEASQSEIVAAFYPPVAFTNGYGSTAYDDTTALDGAFPITPDAGGPVFPPRATEEALLAQINEAKHELELLRLLRDDFAAHRALIDPWDRNHPTMWPVAAYVSSGFGNRICPFGTGRWQFHTGLDIANPVGTPIRAAGGGTVTFSGFMAGGMGITVVIDHGNGYETLYGHNRANTVRVGDRVERGDIIAHIGMTGSTTGPHVHFEVRRNGNPVNPRPFMAEFYD